MLVFTEKSEHFLLVSNCLIYLQVHDILCKALAEHIKKHLTNELRRQIVFELLGEQFVKQYFSDIPPNPTLIVSISIYPFLFCEEDQTVTYS